ncbi:hypothetical protein T552_01368 [Pneumocystis carinii B80]|uniref:F-box domain-containing protein n=1 Tax=Pneumocystis carinii (strain B80) TaxID=1408658 RepID=A0A0W4ZM19_PNEC8|nr:hypothetical protein T552_01368 [Pneumocystis carinii B80]KTW29417.1 hypothetical protein T552_01368 [Pneumocystis carinii B80]
MSLEEYTSLVSSFKDIYNNASPHLRQLIIDTLFIESSPVDIWYIHQKFINKKPYYFDILGHLPYELLEMVFKYLDIEDIIVFSMVCRRWNTLISCNLVAKMLINVYFNGQTIKDTNNDWYSLFQKFAKKYIRMKKGELKSFNILYPYNKVTSSSLYTRLYDNHLVLYNHSITESFNKGITLYCLRPGISQKDAIYISTESYGGMLNVSLDSYIIVGVNYFGVFYIWSLHTLELIDTFKLGSSDVASMTCCNNNICINTFSQVLSVWNLKFKKFMFYKTLEQIDPNLSKKCNVIIIEFLKRNNELILCIENMTSNNEISYYQYRIYVLSPDCGRILRYGSLMNKNMPFKTNIINEDELMIFYELNSGQYLKMDLKTMHAVRCLFHKNHIQELDYLVYLQNSFIIKNLKSIDNSSDNGLYVEKCDPETGLLLSKNKILGSENIIYSQSCLKNKDSLQGNNDWIVYNHQNKVFLWEL